MAFSLRYRIPFAVGQPDFVVLAGCLACSTVLVAYWSTSDDGNVGTVMAAEGVLDPAAFWGTLEVGGRGVGGITALKE
jgi:hypothetical protein